MALLVAVAGAILENWYPLAAMVLLVLSQLINFRANRHRVD
jgi:hypothetical protein